MRSSYGKEMEGASSDAKEIEGIVAQPIQPDTSTHNRLHDETNLPTIDWSSTSAPTSIVPCFIMRILPIRCSFLGPSSFIRPDRRYSKSNAWDSSLKLTLRSAMEIVPRTNALFRGTVLRRSTGDMSSRNHASAYVTLHHEMSSSAITIVIPLIISCMLMEYLRRWRPFIAT